MKVKSESEVAQSCVTLSNPMDCSLPGSPIHGIFQARVLEWGAIAFSCVTLLVVVTFFNMKSLSRVRLLATPWTAACQAPPSMGFSRQEYWSGVPLLLFLKLFKSVHYFGVVSLALSRGKFVLFLSVGSTVMAL